MPSDADLNFNYFMRNWERLLLLLRYLKEHPEITDTDIKSDLIKKKITIEGLGLWKSYSRSVMDCLTQFILKSGGIDYLRSAPIELIVCHKAIAVYLIL